MSSRYGVLGAQYELAKAASHPLLNLAAIISGILAIGLANVLWSYGVKKSVRALWYSMYESQENDVDVCRRFAFSPINTYFPRANKR